MNESWATGTLLWLAQASTSPNGPIEAANAIATDPKFGPLRAFVGYVATIGAAARLAMPFLAEHFRNRRAANSVRTPEGYVSYRVLYEDSLPRILKLNEQNERLNAEIAQKNTQIAVLLATGTFEERRSAARIQQIAADTSRASAQTAVDAADVSQRAADLSQHAADVARHAGDGSV